uniref:Uncharacterized protein n=1 Tax=Alexandrium monilatum TaxID=311494 RepID=A0A7S4RGX9_9DINO
MNFPRITDKRFTGTVAKVVSDCYFGDELKNYAFIHCPELRAVFDRDVFWRPGETLWCTSGDVVSFQVGLNRKGGLTAWDVSPGSEDPADCGAALDLGAYSGRVSFVDRARSWGAVRCAELLNAYEGDAFVHSADVKEVGVGDMVTVQVTLHPQGLLQA